MMLGFIAPFLNQTPCQPFENEIWPIDTTTPRARLHSTATTIQPRPKHPRASKGGAMRSAFLPCGVVRGHLRAGSLALLGLLAHAGHAVFSLFCRTTSKTLHLPRSPSVLSPNREAFPISDNGRPGMTSPVFASRAYSTFAVVELNTRWAPSASRSSIVGSVGRERVGP